MNLFKNPVLIKELRARMRGNRAMIILTIYLSLIGIVTMLIYLTVASSLSFGSSNFDAGRAIGRAIFTTVIVVALAQVCIIAPALTSGSISGEKERQSYDLLITTLLSPWQIVLGKLWAALAFALLLVISVLPLAGLSFLFGGVSLLELVLAMIGLIIAAMLYSSIGLMWSTIMRGTQGAAIMSQGTVLLWLLGIPFLFIVFGTILFERDIIDITETAVFIYISGIFLSSHPFIALGLSQASIANGDNPFFFPIDPTGVGDEIWVPSPWLGFTVIGLILTVIALAVSARLLRPVNPAVAGRSRRRKPN